MAAWSDLYGLANMKWQKAGETFVRYKFIANENIRLQPQVTVFSRIEETNLAGIWTHALETKSETDEHFISIPTTFQFVFQKLVCPAKIFSAMVGGTGIFSRLCGDTSMDLV